MISGTWSLGHDLCDVWLCIDYTLSMASVSNLMLICLDRYFSVTRPFTYRAKRTCRRARVFIIIAWVLSFLLWSPAIIIWHRVRERITGNHCFIQFLEEDKSLTVITAIIAFYLPVLVMCVLYGLIYRETQKCSQYLEYLKSYKKRRATATPASPRLQVHQLLHRESMPACASSSEKNGLLNVSDRPRFLSVDQGRLSSADNRYRLGLFSILKRDTSKEFCEKWSSNGSKMPESTYTFLRQEKEKSAQDSNDKHRYSSTPKLKNNAQESASHNFFSFMQGKIEENPSTSESVSETCSSKEVESPLLNARLERMTKSKSEPIGLRAAVQNFEMSSNSKGSTVKSSDSHVANPTSERRTSRDDMIIGKTNKRESSAVVKMPSTEKKAARTLSAILLAFIITWLPYNICAVYKAFCFDPNNCIPETVWDVAYYLCYINSTVNPFCFALCNKTFRRTFKQILCCEKCKNKQFVVIPKAGCKPVKIAGPAGASSSSSQH